MMPYRIQIPTQHIMSHVLRRNQELNGALEKWIIFYHKIIVRGIKLNWFGNVKNTRYVHWPTMSFKDVYRGKRREGPQEKPDLTTSHRGLGRT